MGGKLDLTGQVYGDLTVLEDTGKRFHRSVVWLCHCSCGNECEVPAIYLRSGSKTNCGCKKRKTEKRKQPKIKDISGLVFGELTAIRPTEKRQSGSIVWECVCSCGKTVYEPAIMLRYGSASSCGHNRGRKKGPNSGKNLTGKIFGELTVLRYTDERNSYGGILWECQCSCGKICKFSTGDLIRGIVKSCGHEKLDLKSGKRPVLSENDKLDLLINEKIDLVGTRVGRLVVLGGIKRSISYWFCRCDCGRSIILEKETAKKQKFCGSCLIQKPNKTIAICPVCKGEFQIVFDDNPTPQFCEECSKIYAGNRYFICPVCDKLFESSSVDNAITCHDELCEKFWSSYMRRRMSEKTWISYMHGRVGSRKTLENLKKANDALKVSPNSGRFVSNNRAKIWTLIDPSGNEIVVRNLLLWARENAGLFGKPNNDKSASQISSGFKAIAKTLAVNKNVSGKPIKAKTYFGWTLKEIPKKPED